MLTLTVVAGVLGIGRLPCFAAEEVLNNASVITLEELNLGDAVIIDKIKTSKCDFDTSISGLSQLKAGKASDAVIQAMLATKASFSVAAPIVTTSNLTPIDLNNPISPHAAGVWIITETNGQKNMTRVEFEHAHSASRGVGWLIAYGAKVENYVFLPGAKADLQLSQRRPIFYFYLANANQTINQQSGSTDFLSVENPKEIVLVKFQTKKESENKINRELSLTKGNAYSKSSTIDKSIRDFDSIKIADGIYKIVPKNDLADGEYAFSKNDLLDDGNDSALAVASSGSVQNQIFPFGIQSTNLLVRPSNPDVEKLCASLHSTKTGEVDDALKKLRDMDAPEAVPQILGCLTNSNSKVVRDACQTLAVLGNKEVIPSIEPLLKDTRLDVRKDAQDAIDILMAK